MAHFGLAVDGRTFRDSQNREVTLRGINVAGDAKFPAVPNQPSHVSDEFFDGDNVSFVGRPFSVEDAHIHLRRLRKWGYNTIRYIFTWEAIEHAGPGRYDEEWIAHTVKILRVAKDYGFYVFMDPHQDVWSRFSGGSGAPMWTLYACGLDPRSFDATEAAIVQNTSPQPEEFPKMIWATNYQRLACQVVFTMFFAGREFAPKAIIDGKNIQDYLQEHFIAACRHLAERIHEAGDLEGDVVIGWESFNEPNRGLVGWQDITEIPNDQRLRKGTAPTAWQAILTGSGRACEIDAWDFGGMGPYKSGKVLIDPAGRSAWLSPESDYDDSKYGWRRDPGWKLGECIWAQHGVWDPSTDALLQKDYFSRHPSTGEPIDYPYFTNYFFMRFYRRYSCMVRKVFPGAILFCQPPVLEIPPLIKGTPDDDPNMVFAPHFYDGITLVTKKWNRLWNVDVIGVLRGRYWSPAFAIRIGETAIRNCFRDQLSFLQNEALDTMGLHPCVFTEIGIPYDMDDKYAYRTGDYASQVAAMDANHYALEGSRVNGFALWTYVATNNHRWGDQWNGEDLSIFSSDDSPLPSASLSRTESATSLDRRDPSFSESRSSDADSVSPSILKQAFTTEDMSLTGAGDPEPPADRPGYRAAEAYVRPSPIATHGDLVSYGFNLRECAFTMTLCAPSSTREDAPTEIFLPDYHFPLDGTTVDVTGGKFSISNPADRDVARRLRWWHAEGDQTITIQGVKRRAGAGTCGAGVEAGYIEQCQSARDWATGCGMM